jgi:HK97 family phage prohead protease
MLEHKLIDMAHAEVKFSDEGAFEGYASTFNGVDSYGDMILPGAYSETLKNRSRPLAMFFNHVPFRSDMPAKIGRWEHAEEDSKGLLVKGKLTVGHPTADAVRASMKAGTIDGLSIGFRIAPGGSEKDGKIRKLKKIDLVEVSVVENPADGGARVSLDSIKSTIDEINSLADAEAVLREAAFFSKASARDFIARVNSVIRREAGGTEAKEVADYLQRMKDRLNSQTLPTSLKG